jgi:hypothetical protein
MKRLAGLTLALLSFSVSAKPVYLTCTTTYQNDPPRTFSVTIDEETGKITQQFLTGYSFNADGFFTATEVSYKKVDCSAICMTQEFTINRVDLTIRTSMIMSATNVGNSAPITSTGTCKLETPPERKF